MALTVVSGFTALPPRISGCCCLMAFTWRACVTAFSRVRSASSWSFSECGVANADYYPVPDHLVMQITVATMLCKVVESSDGVHELAFLLFVHIKFSPLENYFSPFDEMCLEFGLYNTALLGVFCREAK